MTIKQPCFPPEGPKPSPPPPPPPKRNDFSRWIEARVQIQHVQVPRSIIRGKIRLYGYKYDVDVTPEQAREYAAAILKAADEAEWKGEP